MPVLEVSHLKKSFGNLEVLKDISMTVNQGEVVAIIGPSGSGKSTLLRCINQLEKPDSGSIRVCGEEMMFSDPGQPANFAPADVLRRIRLRIGLVFQDYNLFPHFSVLRNITEAPIKVLGQSKQEATQKAKELLQKMGLEDKADAYPYQLSGGQAQRVSIARALALSPQLLFFDEPTSALDPELTGEILKVIRALAQERMTMVIVTHEMAFAGNVADKIIFMSDGVIVEEGTPEQVMGQAQNERTRAFLQNYGVQAD